MRAGFAVWITGLPASGKSTVATALARELSTRGIDVAVLESDALRRIFTPDPRYSEEERDIFYGAMTHVGQLLTEHGVPVIFDATANRRAYRDRARQHIPRFVEVYVDCPLDVCMNRDPKGIYHKAQQGEATTVPGLQSAYEPPENPEVRVRGDREAPEMAARRVVAILMEKGYLSG
ncbi:MAG: adenylyl-sulfate kinase [Candidatus Methylomirabilales bacterium]